MERDHKAFLEQKLLEVFAENGLKNYVYGITRRYLKSWISESENIKFAEDIYQNVSADLWESITTNPDKYKASKSYNGDLDEAYRRIFWACFGKVARNQSINFGKRLEISAKFRKDLNTKDLPSNSSDTQAAHSNSITGSGPKTRQTQRSRLFPPDDPGEAENFWGDILPNRSDALGYQGLSELVEKAGLSERETYYIQEYAAGLTYKKLAERDGGTEDRYRKIVSRAIEKMKKRLVN